MLMGEVKSSHSKATVGIFIVLWSGSVTITKQPNEERIINNKYVNFIYKLRNKCELNYNQNTKIKGKAKVARAELPASGQP